MTSRWSILAVLFFARTAMAFQYQSVAALSPQLVDSYLLSIADLGVLIGLYLGPGIFVAIPGGTIAARFGDKRVTMASLGLMLAGAVMITFASDWNLIAAGRVLAGAGGVVINVIMTKMLVDWFEGREIGTAMGIFICSWPAGIALALLILPVLAAHGGLVLADTGVITIIAVAIVALAVIYRPASASAAVAAGTPSRGLPLTPLLAAGGVWALYNAGCAMVFAFGPLLLTEQGMTAATAGPVISFFMFTLAIGVPLGGLLADRTGRTVAIISASLLSFAFCLLVLPVVPPVFALPAYGIAGLIAGLAAGPVMTLPSKVLAPPARALGMGVFFTIYYVAMMSAPAIGGYFAEKAADAGAAYVCGIVMVACALGCLLIYQRSAQPAQSAA